MRFNEDDDSKVPRSQEQCHCCKHYGFPCLQNKPSKKKVKMCLNGEDNMDKKRKANSALGSNQHLSTTTLPHPALIPSQKKSSCMEFGVSQAKTTPHEVYIDGWMITYKEFQPRKAKKAQKQANG
jgi:hypothetical protein